MSEIMASPSVAIDSLFAGSGSASGGEGEGGQAKSPSASDSPKATPEGAGKGESATGKTPEATTAKAEGAATPPAKESADLPDEFKPFDRTLKAKKWDPKSKEFVPTVLKSFEDLEKSFTQSNQDKSLLNARQADFQRRLLSDAKEINEFRKKNGAPEIPVGKSYADLAKEKSALFNHVNDVLLSLAGPNGLPPQVLQSEAFKQLNAHFSDLEDLRIEARLEAKNVAANKGPEAYIQDLRAKAHPIYSDHIAKNPDDKEIFDNYVMPLADPKGLLGSYGLDLAHIAMTPEHAAAWAQIGRALKLAANYDAALKEGIDKGVDAAMEAKRKAGNAGSVGAQGKQSGGDGSKDDEIRSFWAGRHG